MALESEQSFVVYNGTGFAAVGYPIPFTYTDPAHLQVSTLGVGAATPTVQPASAFYVVDNPAAVFMRAGIPATTKVTIERVVPYTQPTVYPEGGRILTQTQERVADRGVMQAQQLARMIGQSIRLPLTSDAPEMLSPTAGALMGFDTAGKFAHYSQARVRELAQLEGGVDTNSMATFADAAARAARVPDFTGQVGVQRDDSSLWVSTGTSAGNWTKARFPSTIVESEDELLAAIGTSRRIIVRGRITLSDTLVLDTDGTELIGDGLESGLVLPHNGLSAVTVVSIQAKRVSLYGLEITSDHPLTSATTIRDIGVSLSTDSGTDISYGSIRKCRIHHLGYGVVRFGESTSTWCDHFEITGKNNFHSFLREPIYIRYRTRSLEISHNRFCGKETTDTHRAEGNGMWVGNYCDYAQIHHNEIFRVGRHPIEYWNSQDSPANVDGNKCAKIAFNTIHSPLFTSFDHSDAAKIAFGISAFGCGTTQIFGNSVDGCNIGIELYGDKTNTGGPICFGNFISNSLCQGISVNGVPFANVFGNIIGRVDMLGASLGGSIGIQIINGGQHVTVRGNRCTDSGVYGVLVNGKRCVITAITQEADALFTVSTFNGGTSAPNGWFVGKKICLREIVGMTELNDRYYTITELTGSTFRCGVDTTGYTAYTSDGIVQEDYRSLSICDNEFTVNEAINGATFARAIWVYDIQQAVIRCNTRFKKAGLPSNYGSFSVSNKGIVYHDFTGTPVTTSAADLATVGSNQDITIFT